MNLVRLWNERARAMFVYIERGKQALEKLGYVENVLMEDDGGATVVTTKGDKMFNSVGAFLVGVYLHTVQATELSEYDLDKVLVTFDCLFWQGTNLANLKESVETLTLWDKEAIEWND